VQRRRVLAGAAALVGLTGCLGDSRPELSLHTGVGRLHPASERYLTDGLEPGGVRSEYAAAVPDTTPEAVAPAAPDSLAERLRGDREAAQFHVLTELRSTPTEPLRFGTGQAVDWADGALRFTTNVTPVALISPLTLVVFDLQGEPVSLGETLFATGPTAIAAALLFGLGLGVYREEDLFTQKPVTRKTLDALAVRLSAVGEGVRESPPTGLAARLPKRARGLAAVAVLTACTIPFVFVAELLAVAVLFALPVTVSIPILLVAVALVEEVAKSLHLYAGFERGVLARTDRVAVAVGLASGLGFFLAEKATAAAQAVGLTELYVGRAAFGAAAGAGGLSPLVLVGLVLAPLALHGTTATISAVGARRSRTAYAATLAAATLVHAAYNLGVVRLYG